MDLVLLRSWGGEGLEDLVGLTSLESVVTLEIAESVNLVSLEGLETLHEAENVKIRNNMALESLTGLGSLTSIGIHLHIDNNPVLATTNGLNIAQVYDLTIEDCPVLADLTGLLGINSIPGLSIARCHALRDLHGLDNLAVAELGLGIVQCNSLQSLEGLESLVSVGVGGLILRDLPSLTTLSGLQNLTSVGGLLRLTSCNSLISVDRLDALKCCSARSMRRWPIRPRTTWSSSES